MRDVVEQPFIDEVEITVEAGCGGDGVVHWRREIYVPKGGPDGGDGGRGGDVVLVASPHVNTLNALRRRRHIKAGDGRNGARQRMTGAGGEDVRVDVPVGTLVFDLATADQIADLDASGKEAVVAAGGRGGLGNWHFRSSTNRAPERATPGREGERRDVRLELRLIADVGLVGLPNAGKSSTIRRLTRAHPKVADYPFTTLVPNLGVVEDPWGDGYVIADVPGLIEGAAEGAGLGHQFLRHLARTRLLVHVIDAGAGNGRGLLKVHDMISRELAHSPVEIAAPLDIVLLNKADLRPADDRAAIGRSFKRRGLTAVWGSTVTGEGMDELKRLLAARLEERRVQEEPACAG